MRPIGIILTLLIITGIVVFVYFNYNQNLKSEELLNLSVSADYNRQKIITQLQVGEQLINTSQYYEILIVPKGEITIKNINIEEQNYYENSIIYNITENQKRIDFPLDKPIIPEIKILKLNPLIIEIKSINFKGTNFCLKSSVNFVFVETNSTKIPKPKGYENFDLCYGTFELIGSEVFEIKYLPLSNPTDDDYLNITVFDKAQNSITKRLI